MDGWWRVGMDGGDGGWRRRVSLVFFCCDIRGVSEGCLRMGMSLKLQLHSCNF